MPVNGFVLKMKLLKCGKTMTDELFNYKLKNNMFKTAYDVLARRYVRIQKINQDPTGAISITARRESDGVVRKYRPNELSKYA